MTTPGPMSTSGAAWTVLKPGAFVGNLPTEAAAIRQFAAADERKRRPRMGATADTAAVVARILADLDLQGQAGDGGKTYLLTKDRPRSFLKIASLLTEALGCRVRYLQLPVFYARLSASGVPDWRARGLAHQYVDVVRRGQDGGRLCSRPSLTCWAAPPPRSPTSP
ncbi:hypothetical protein Kisp01_41970 [Kineosporia sp. NBRC 101677]|uniref:hypothetical protein n=1 Tax=Kineosporia sp. NBRC 101677 TaxID=3032197 RepID=UPI0024A3CCF8|nr:hypothetical protein [Kineosporia sp. NBRC 101677]GLY17182.1 hypothetical protein Kisp01_41970 [Kineosporia sp. NBRC 101677]